MNTNNSTAWRRAVLTTPIARGPGPGARIRRRSGLVRVVVAVGAVMSLGIGLLLPSSERWVVRTADESSSAGDLPYLQVDGRFLTAGGEPFFWLADTAWAMLGKLSTDEITDYLDVRADQGFNVVQTVAMFPQAGAESPGDTVEAAAQNDEYWENVEFAIDAAAARGLYLAIHPVWGDKQTGSLLQLILKFREPESALVSVPERRSAAARGGCRGVAGPGRVCRAGTGR